MKYRVTMTETIVTVVEVEADSVEEAKEAASDHGAEPNHSGVEDACVTDCYFNVEEKT